MKDFVSREIGLGCLATPIAIPIGAVIVYVVMGIVTADFSTAFGILIFSIICTAGISLLLWIPIWYAVGYGTLIVLRVILGFFGVDIGGIFGSKKAKSTPDDPKPAQPALSRDQQALLNYIKKARAKGLSDEQISQNLTSNGWKAQSVTDVFQMI